MHDHDQPPQPAERVAAMQQTLSRLIQFRQCVDARAQGEFRLWLIRCNRRDALKP